jgi:hypothetical protein
VRHLLPNASIVWRRITRGDGKAGAAAGFGLAGDTGVVDGDLVTVSDIKLVKPYLGV